MPESLFNKVAGLSPTTLLKGDSGTGVSCEFCEISKNTFSYRKPLMAASAYRTLLYDDTCNGFGSNKFVSIFQFLVIGIECNGRIQKFRSRYRRLSQKMEEVY